MTPLVHVILVNWNGFDDTVACVESCLALTYEAFKVVVVDNGSADGSGERLRQRFAGAERVEVLLTGRNLGFAGGNNIGIANAIGAEAEYVWLLNNDTTVDPEALSALVSAAEEHPEDGMFGSKVYFYDRPQTLWYAGGFIRPQREGSAYHRGLEEVDRGQYDVSEVVDYITGCSLLVSTDLIHEIGPMAEDYFLYWEEVDWCARALAAGRACRYVPASRVWHKVGASVGSVNSPVQKRYDARNRLVFYWRNRRSDFGRVWLWFNRQLLGFALRQHRGSDAAIMLKAEWDFFTGKRGRVDAA